MLKQGERPLRYRVDASLCEGYRFCREQAPRLIEVTGDGPAQIAEGADAEDARVLARAMRSCPRRAISPAQEVVPPQQEDPSRSF